jgi:AraC-like DNA-binding protein
MDELPGFRSLYARIARFEATLDAKARAPARSWAQLARQFGYSDQMHLVHEFRQLAGRAPADTATQLDQVRDTLGLRLSRPISPGSCEPRADP